MLYDAPRLFQLWVYNQVMDVAGTNYNLVKRNKEEHNPCCSSCGQEIEIFIHVMHCNEAGRVDAMKRSIGWLDDWLQSVGTEPTLQRALVKYALGRGTDLMKDIVFEEGRNYRDMGISQDRIGWRRFTEGIILKETVKQQKDFVDPGGCSISLEK